MSISKYTLEIMAREVARPESAKNALSAPDPHLISGGGIMSNVSAMMVHTLRDGLIEFRKFAKSGGSAWRGSPRYAVAAP